MDAPLTGADFLSFYPQFAAAMPPLVLDEYIAQANIHLAPSIWGDWLAEGRRLYTAHKCTQYLKTAAPEEAEGSQVAKAGAAKGTVMSKSVGGVSLSYGESRSSAGLSGWGDLKETEYGLALLSLARRLYPGAVYIP